MHQISPLMLLGTLCGLLLLPGPGEAEALACSAEQRAAIEKALQEAPLSSSGEGDDGQPPAPQPPGMLRERRCGLTQAQVVRQVLAACQPTREQAVLYLGGGRCLQQVGLLQEAARAYRAYIALGDPTVSPEHARERRDRVRRWLLDMGEAAPDTAVLVLSSNLGGALVRHLDHYPEGLTLGPGDNRILQPPGSRRLSLSINGFNRVEVPVDLVDGLETRAAVDWRSQLSPRYAYLQTRWDDFARSGLTPAGYTDRKQRPLSIALGLIVAAGGAALVGVCAANVNDACDAGWKQGVAYSAGALLGLGGLVGVFTAVVAPLEKLPPPGGRQDGHAAALQAY